MLDQASQASKHHRDVRSEHPAAHVCLVDHDQREPEEEVGPSGVIREDRQVEHVGVREHEVRVLADQRPLGLRRVAVVGRRADLRELQGADRAELVARERLRREQIEGRRSRHRHRGLGEGDVVHERLAARRAGREDHVSAGSERLEAPGLMRIEPFDAEQPEAGAHDLRQILGEWIQARLPGAELPRPDETGRGLRVVRGQLFEEGARIHRTATRRAAATGDPPRLLRARLVVASPTAPRARRRTRRGSGAGSADGPAPGSRPPARGR